MVSQALMALPPLEDGPLRMCISQYIHRAVSLYLAHTFFFFYFSFSKQYATMQSACGVNFNADYRYVLFLCFA